MILPEHKRLKPNSSRYSQLHEIKRSKLASSSKDRLSKATLLELVRYCDKHRHKGNWFASLALLSLVTGYSFTKLLSDDQRIELTGLGVAKLYSTWNLAQTPELALPMLNLVSIERDGYIVVPEWLAEPVIKMREEGITADDCTKKFKSFLTNIKPTTDEHVTPARLANVLGYQKHQFGISSFELSFIANEPKDTYSQNSYIAFHALPLLEKHVAFMNQYIDVTDVRNYLSSNIPDDLRFGSPRVLTHDSVIALFEYLRSKLRSALQSRYDYAEIHNCYTDYVINLLQLATLHRPHANIFRTLEFFDFNANTVEILDKDLGSNRLIPLCDYALRELKQYLKYLRSLERLVRFDSPSVAESLGKTLKGKENLFREWRGDILLDDFQSLTNVYQRDKTYSSNWHRHFMMTSLFDSGIDRYAVNTYSGHQLKFEHIYERSKNTKFEQLREVSKVIEGIIIEMNLFRPTNMHQYFLKD